MTGFPVLESLELVDERLSDLFTALCVEVADRVAATPDRAVAALRDALKDRCSMGEVCAAMKDVFGAYQQPASF